MPQACLRSLYFALVYAHILYGVELYANTNVTYLNKLHKLNNKLLRILQERDSKCKVACLYKEYNTLSLPIDLLYEKHSLLFIHSSIYNKD